jgi:hypothetical protein
MGFSKKIGLFICIAFCVAITSCKKDTIFVKGDFSFSTDTLLFDTVFTTIGSATKNFKVYNGNAGRIKFSEIRLMGGENSPFRLNFDGASGFLHADIEMDGKDSLFGFVDVTLSVNNDNYPLVYLDSIRFTSEGKQKYLYLAVWGQDVYIHNRDISEGVWANDKPHLVYGYTAVDSNKTLTLLPGTQVYFHKNASFVVYKGALDIQGELGNEVVFQGDRLEAFYSDNPGQWYGIRFIEATPSVIDYAIIKNGQVGVQIDSTGTNSSYTVEIKNSKILNQSFFGVYPVAGARLKMENCVVNNAGIASAYLFAGGAYNFNHCTFANYNALGRSTPLFVMQNYFQSANTIYVRPIDEAFFTNCVFYGSLIDEFNIDLLTHPSMNYTFDHCLIRNSVVSTESNFVNCNWNIDPGFESTLDNDFKFKLPSPLNNTANPLTSLSFDINGVSRSGPDIGAYEVVD